ncbi:hypothetical protein, partial [Klebsiella pneumoniae]|uniref:hypothetical protein n=1 Tax=Klebsiella pneumoniae TaxID=573 RepID=UPI00405539CA
RKSREFTEKIYGAKKVDKSRDINNEKVKEQNDQVEKVEKQNDVVKEKLDEQNDNINKQSVDLKDKCTGKVSYGSPLLP